MPGKIFIESLDPEKEHSFGILIHKIIANYVFSDLGIGEAVEIVRILVDIKKPLFAVYVRIGSSPSPITIGDYARLSEEADGIHITISDESYAKELLETLWERFGRDSVRQIDRWESVVPSEVAEKSDIKDSVIAEPGEEMRELVMSAIKRIIPEGFRIGFLEHEDRETTVIASENPIDDEWVEEVKNALDQPPTPIPEEELEKVKKKPRRVEDEKLEKWGKPWKVK